MSGIFGFLEPGGVEVARCEAAVSQVESRGEPAMVHLGQVTLGAFLWDNDGPATAILETGSSILIADARVDAPIDGTDPGRLDAGGGLELLDATLRDLGPGGLEGLAAEYALARFDHRRRELVLARDHVGVRPLFWARHGRRFGFACDPAILIAAGLASGDLDREGILTSLALGVWDEDSSGFAGVHRLRVGHCMRTTVGGPTFGRRWFFPERVTGRIQDLAEAAQRTREAILAATASRVKGELPALLLSSGRDSGSIAVALSELGVRARCLTCRFDSPEVVAEPPAASALARSLAHEWEELFVTARPTADALNEIPSVSGGPLGIQIFPLMFAIRDRLADAGSTVLLDGQGGEPLFTAPPIAVLDLARLGDLVTAARAVRGFQHQWGVPYSVIAKEVLRGMSPTGLLKWRERNRRRPPWLIEVPAKAIMPRPRSAREYTLRALKGGEWDNELFERMLQPLRMRYSSPLFDMRVIRVALQLPERHLVPAAEPKPVLAAAVLGGWARSRAKVPFTAYFERLADSLQADFPSLFGEGSLCSWAGFVRGNRLAECSRPEWRVASLAVVPLEMWLRVGGGRE